MDNFQRSLSDIIVTDDLGGAQLVVLYIMSPQSTGCGFVSKDSCRVAKQQLSETFRAGQCLVFVIKTFTNQIHHENDNAFSMSEEVQNTLKTLNCNDLITVADPIFNKLIFV